MLSSVSQCRLRARYALRAASPKCLVSAAPVRARVGWLGHSQSEIRLPRKPRLHGLTKAGFDTPSGLFTR